MKFVTHKVMDHRTKLPNRLIPTRGMHAIGHQYDLQTLYGINPN